MPSVTLAFARNAGVEPVVDEWPELREALLYGPLLPISFRISNAIRSSMRLTGFGQPWGPCLTGIRRNSSRPEETREKLQLLSVALTNYESGIVGSNPAGRARFS